ncbi:cupin domain-containing protein [Streptomyces sp. NPDC089915]|uniref:JmjC domain-containing protein n=1 Tax=Streptomyces sp. NPDC089915 TaxID=3155186 RepID=UPI00343472D0
MHSPTLAAWVGDPDDFAAAYWRRRPGVFRPEGGAHSPFTLADVDAALATGFLSEPYLEMARAEEPLGREAYLAPRTVNQARHGGFADERRVRALLDEGATLLMRRVDQWHGPTRDLLARLSAELGLAVEAFCFVTPPGTQGVPLHRDDADVLVVQLNGAKSWHVAEGPADGNWEHGRVEGEPPAEVLRTTLRAGEVLYIPRGFAHEAVGSEGLSAHLSLTVREVHKGDLFRSLQKLTAKGMAVETRPLDDAAVLAAAKGMLDHVRAVVAALEPEHLVDHARRAKLAELPAPRAPISLGALAEGLGGPA